MKIKSFIDAKREFEASPELKAVVAAIVEREGKNNTPEVTAFLAQDFVIRWIAYRDLLPTGEEQQ